MRILKLLLSPALALFISPVPDLLTQTASAASNTIITLSPTTSPGVGEPGVTLINVTGNGFPTGSTTPNLVLVSLQPAVAGSGPALSALVTSVITIVGTAKRVTFQIMAGNPVKVPTAYLVSVSGATSTGATFSSGNTAALTVNPPAVISLNPSSGQPGQSLTVSIAGTFTNFFQGSTQANFGPGISVGGAASGAAGPVTVNSPTMATAQLTIDPAATAGPRDVSVRTGSELATLPAGFSIIGPTSSAAIVQVNPNNGQQGQSNLSVIITGQSTHFVPGTSQPIFGSDITVNTVSVSGATSLTANISIPANANLGGHTVTVTTGTEVASITNGFTVTPGTPILVGLNPNSGRQRQTLTGVVLTGAFTHFTQGTPVVTFSNTSVTASNIVITDNTHLTATITIAANSPTGSSNVTAVTGSENASGVGLFTVTSGAPILLSVNPNSGQQGQQNLPVTITGQFTHFQQGVSQATFGGGITVVSLTVNSPTSATAVLNIDPSAATGPRTVTVTTGSEVDTLNNGFTVTPSTPIGLSVNPPSGQQGQQNLPVTLTGQSSHFLQGVSQASFGASVTIRSLTVSSPTSANAILNIDAAAAVGGRTVTMSTGGEVGTLNNGFLVTAGPPTLVSVNPNTGQQGQQSLPVIITGQFTHFAQGASQASFGAGVTVSSLTVSSPTTATAILNIDPAAATGPRTVTITTGGELATLLNGFTVTASAPILVSINPNSGQQGQQNLPVTLTGLYTHFLQGASQVSFGAGITVVALTVNSPTSAAAILNIDYSATAGPRTVVMTTGTEVATLNNGFAVIAPTPALLSVNPNSGQQGQQNLAVTITGQFTHFQQGITQASFGAGVTVVSLTVNSFTNATAVLNIDPAATPGVRALTVTTGTEGETLANAFTVTSPTIGITATPGSWNFGPVPITTSAKQTFTLTSTGTSPLTINSITFGGPFFTVGNLPTFPLVLAPSASASFLVTYAPLGTIFTNAIITVNSNAPTSPTLISVSGTGSPPPLPPAGAITVTTDRTAYPRAQPIQISGTLTAAGGSGISNIQVNVQVAINGSTRTLNPYTDSQGNYSITFQPAATDGGTFSVTATAASDGVTKTASTTFRIFGLVLSPNSLAQDLVMGNTTPIPLSLQNVGDAALNNVSYSAIVTPSGPLTATFPQPIASLGSGALVTVPMALTAPSGNPPPTPLTVRVTITSVDSVSGFADTETGAFVITLRPSVSTLSLVPTSLNVGVHPGGSLTRQFAVQNNGYVPTNNSTVTLQDPATFNWVSLGNANLGNIAPGGAYQTFQVLISAPPNLALGNYTVVFNVSGGSNALQGTVNIAVTQSTLGAVAFVVSDDIGAKVGGATVTIYGKTNGKMFQGVTASDGTDTIMGVDAGDYTYVVSAPLHDPATGSVTVMANATAQVNVLMSYDVVNLTFTVTPTTIVDQYNVVLNITYTTTLPKPALQVVPPNFNFSFFPADVPGGKFACSVTITNTSSFSAVSGVTVDSSQLDVAQPSGQAIHVQFSDGSTLYKVGDLAPQASSTVACYATLDGNNVPTHSAGNIVVKGTYTFSLDGNPMQGTTSTNVPVSYNRPADLSYQSISFIYDLSNLGPPGLRYNGGSFVYTVTSERTETLNLLKLSSAFGGHNLVAFTAPLSASNSLDTINANQANVFWHTDFSSLKQSLLGQGDTTTYDISTPDNGLTLQQAINALIAANGGLPPNVPMYLGFEGQWTDRSSPNGYLIPIKITTITPIGITLPGPGQSTKIGCLNPEDPGCMDPNPVFKAPAITIEGQIQLEIPQKISLERQAFNAMLGIGAQATLNSTVASIQIRDLQGNDASANFFVLVTSDPLGATHGGIVVGQTSVTWQLIPNAGAGGTAPQGVQYQVQATLTYVVNGTQKTATTQTVTITVLPSPKLTVSYTAPYVVMDGKDAKIRVTVQNIGAGPAHNLTIQSAQPTILSSTTYDPVDPVDPTLDVPNLVVSFTLTGSSNTADSGGYLPNNLTINFGDVAPGATVSGYWTLHVTRRGFLTGFTSTFTHQDYQGITLDPLVLPPTTTLIPAVGGAVANSSGQLLPNLTVSLLQGTTVLGSDQTGVTGE